jgi:hypothetical protein
MSAPDSLVHPTFHVVRDLEANFIPAILIDRLSPFRCDVRQQLRGCQREVDALNLEHNRRALTLQDLGWNVANPELRWVRPVPHDSAERRIGGMRAQFRGWERPIWVGLPISREERSFIVRMSADRTTGCLSCHATS